MVIATIRARSIQSRKPHTMNLNAVAAPHVARFLPIS
jgi:hypothetical protein